MSAHVSKKSYVHASSNYLCILLMAMTHSYADDIAVCYVL